MRGEYRGCVNESKQEEDMFDIEVLIRLAYDAGVDGEDKEKFIEGCSKNIKELQRISDTPNVMRPFLVVNKEANQGWSFSPTMLFRITDIARNGDYPVDTPEEVETVLLSFLKYLDEK